MTDRFSEFLHGKPSDTRADESVNEDQQFLHGPFPPSYIDFATDWGYGRSLGLLLIHIPMGAHPDSWSVKTRWIKTKIDEALTEDYLDAEPDGDEALAARLVPFGTGENGQYLCWDPQTRDPDGELEIYVVSSGMAALRRGGLGLDQVLRGCTDQRVKTILGPGYEPLKPTFEALVPFHHEVRP